MRGKKCQWQGLSGQECVRGKKQRCVWGVCVCKEVNPSLAGIIFQGDEIRNMSFVK